MDGKRVPSRSENSHTTNQRSLVQILFTHQSMDVSELQTQLQTLLTTRQKLETQFQENKIVLEELAGVPEDAKVYKLVGPVLLPQQHDDAVGNVEKRLEFIQKEIESVETRMDGLRKKAAEINAAS